jgi:8-oxo-dGTP pyrophosphatase MutT (NUDIX family)
MLPDARGGDAMLRTLAERLAQRGAPRVIAAPRRASVALLLRRRGDEQGELELLYILRPQSPRDPWSGQVAFPGGKQEPGDGGSDLRTALREVKEELGLDLLGDGGGRSDVVVVGGGGDCGDCGGSVGGASSALDAVVAELDAGAGGSAAAPFALLGRLHDAPIFSGGRQREGAAYCCFVFLQRAAATPPLALQAGEVAAVRWVPLSHFAKAGAAQPFALARDGYGLVPTSAAWPAWLRSALGVERAYFPSVVLPLPPAAPPPAPPRMQLWGMSLRATSELLELAGVAGARALCRPPARFDNALANALLEAAAAVEEASVVVARGRPLREASAGARAALALAVAGAAGAAAAAALAVARRARGVGAR